MKIYGSGCYLQQKQLFLENRRSQSRPPGGAYKEIGMWPTKDLLGPTEVGPTGYGRLRSAWPDAWPSLEAANSQCKTAAQLAQLSSAQLSSAQLSLARLSSARLSSAGFSSACRSSAQLDTAQLSQIVSAHLSLAWFSRSALTQPGCRRSTQVSSAQLR